MAYKIYDRKRGKTYFCGDLDDLYNVALSVSLMTRAAVYFDPDASETELIDDLRGCDCRVEMIEEE